MDKLLPITGVGSLPHLTVSSAIEFSKKFDIPFLPELLHLDGDMTQATKNSCLKDFLRETKSCDLIKIQTPSREIGSLKIVTPKNAIHFIDAPFIKDLKPLSGFGLHCCDNQGIDKIIELSPTHYSFDARFVNNPISFVTTLLENQIIPVVGLLSVHEKKIHRPSNYSDWIKTLRDFPMNCWLSPACGLNGFSESECEDIFQELLTIRSEILQLN